LKGTTIKKTISKKQNWLKQVSLTKDDELYVGIDVHKNSYNVALWLNDAPAIDFVTPADNQKVVSGGYYWVVSQRIYFSWDWCNAY